MLVCAAVDCVGGTCPVGLPELSRYLSFGASPRASINLVLAAKALAFLRGRDFARPQDVRDLAYDVMRHRLVLSYEALAEGIGPDDLLDPILRAVSMPDVPLRERQPQQSEAPWTADPR